MLSAFSLPAELDSTDKMSGKDPTHSELFMKVSPRASVLMRIAQIGCDAVEDS